jgi:hypothetical protein
MMDEGTSKAIPIRRSRGTRGVAVRSWSGGIEAGVRLAFAPPRQIWLASLGGTALVVRTLRGLWSQLVAEGGAVETRLRTTLLRRSDA